MMIMTPHPTAMKPDVGWPLLLGDGVEGAGVVPAALVVVVVIVVVGAGVVVVAL